MLLWVGFDVYLLLVVGLVVLILTFGKQLGQVVLMVCCRLHGHAVFKYCDVMQQDL